jgi:hypothetical protein
MQTVTWLSTVFALLLLPLRVSRVRESETSDIRCVPIPFEVELTRADGTKVTARPPRSRHTLYFLTENGWPVPEGPGVTLTL